MQMHRQKKDCTTLHIIGQIIPIVYSIKLKLCYFRAYTEGHLYDKGLFLTGLQNYKDDDYVH